MSVQQKWILSSLIGGLLLLLFPPFLYGPSGAGRQWHFVLDSRYTSYTTTHCYERIRDEPYPYSARIAAFLAKCTKDKKVERGQEGKVDVVVLLLELTILGVGTILWGLHYRLWGYNSEAMSLPVQITFHPQRKQASKEFEGSSPINAAAERVLRGTFTS
jgi:hypothetical protein